MATRDFTFPTRLLDFYKKKYNEAKIVGEKKEKSYRKDMKTIPDKIFNKKKVKSNESKIITVERNVDGRQINRKCPRKNKRARLMSKP